MGGPTSVTCHHHHRTALRNTVPTLGLVPRSMELHTETKDNTTLLRTTHRLPLIKDTRRQISTELHTPRLPLPNTRRPRHNKDTRRQIKLRTPRLLMRNTRRLRLNRDMWRQNSTELRTLLLLLMRTRLLNLTKGTRRKGSTELLTPLLPQPMVTKRRRRPAMVRSASILWMP